MAKIFYVTEKTDDYTQAHFFKTEKEALAYGISEWSDFDMFGDPDSEEDSYDEDNDTWFEGDFINTPSGILFSFEEGRAYLQSSDDDEARKYVKKEVGSDGAAMFFEKFRKGMYGYLGNGADGKGFKWEWDGDEINESLVTEGKEADEAEAILNDLLDERGGDFDELRGMEMEDALDTVEAYGHKGSKAKKIAQELHSLCNESLVTEKFNFSKKEVEAAATLIASAISQADKVKAKVHDLEYDKGRGAGFEISIDGEKYEGGSYVVKDNGDVVNAAIGNSHPNAVYNTIGNKDIANVFINMEKYESLKEQSDDALILIQQALKGMKNMKANIKGDNVIISNKAKDEFVYSLNDGGDVQEFIATIQESVRTENVTTTRKKVLMFEDFVLEGDCKCGGNCTCTTTTTNEAKSDGTISDDEDELMEDLMGTIEAAIDDLIANSRDKAYEIGGGFRGPGNVDKIKKLLIAKVKKMKL